MNKTLIKGAKVLVDGRFSECALLIGDRKILEVDYRGEAPEDTEVIDGNGKFLVPAFIELHAHGGGGFDFADNTQEAFDSAMKTHLAHGVTLLCPTLMTAPWGQTVKSLEFIESHCKDSPMFGGVHLEGPFLSPEMCGAQNLSLFISPDEKKIAELAEFSSVISCVTAAPEIEGAELLAKSLKPRGVSLSIGHSNSDAPTMRKAAEWGFDRVTHLFSGTSRRAKQGSYVIGGIEEQALIDPRFTVELIGDGHHVSKESFLLTEVCKGRDKVALVSDAMRAAGLCGVSESFLGEIKPENRVIIEDGVAKLPDRSSFAGSVAVGDTMTEALCGRYGLPLETVSYMMSAVPARLLGLKKRGEIKCGYDAELVLLDQNYRTVAVFSEATRYYNG